MSTNIRSCIAKYCCTCLLVLLFHGLQAQTNYALVFNGINQYVSIGAPIASNASYTKEAWVYATNTSGPRNIISSLNSPFWISNGTLYAGQAGNYTRVSDPVAIPVNRWIHVAVTYDAGTATMRLYRDGNLVSTATSVPNYSSENEFIGSHAGTASYFAGRIDEVRIWNIALTATQIKNKVYQWPSNNASGLVAYYKCNDGSGSVLNNATGGTNGTLQNSPTWIASPVQYSPNALSMDGTNDHVTIPDDNTLDISTAITLEAWVYATKNTGIQNVISKSSMGTNTGYIFPRTDNGWANAVVYLHIAGGWRTVSVPYPSLNNWHHLAATYDGSMIRVYVNGVQQAAVARTGTIAVNANPLTLGNQPGYSEYFGGAADELRIWNVARSQAQIQADMYRELDPTTQTGLVSYYTFYHGIPEGNNGGLLSVFDQKGNNNGTITNLALSGASSNFVAQNVGMVVLPLNWKDFTLKKQGQNIALQWSTSNEQNTKDFIIQHSTDGATWSDIGTISAAGNSTIVRHYGYLHSSPAAGINFYRILQKDLDNLGSYSEIRSIRLEKTEKSLVIVSTANGAVQFRLNRPRVVRLYSIDGKLLRQKRSGTEPATITGIAKGIYLLQADGQTERIVVR